LIETREKKRPKITYTDEAVLGLELLGRLQVVVDQSEASGLSASESSAETEDEDNLLIDLVHLGELLAELILGDVGAGRVDDIHNLESLESQEEGKKGGRGWLLLLHFLSTKIGRHIQRHRQKRHRSPPPRSCPLCIACAF